MKKIFYPFLLILLSLGFTSAQTPVFSDDFESGLTNWTVTGLWGLTTAYANSPTNSFTDSPAGNYPDMFSSSATMNVSADLSFALDADVQFYAMVDLETAFDYVYLDVSTDAGGTWTNVYVLNGEGMFTWTLYDIPLGAFVGGPDVRLRFRFESDAAYNVDGIYIDDLTIYQYNVDLSPPLILHTPTNLYEGTLGDNPISADVIDASDIASTTLWYSADGGPYSSVAGINTAGDNYLYEIPTLTPGTWVSYYIEATDDYAVPNTAVSDTFEYIAGNYIGYDDGSIDFVQDIGDSSTFYRAAAVRVTLTGITDVVSMVIQNYTDYSRPNNDIRVHVWADSSGKPGADMITPFFVTPEPTLEEPNRGTRVDLRGLPELEGILGDVFIGFDVPGGLAWVSLTSALDTNRTYIKSDFGGWAAYYGDFHFRVVTTELEGMPEALYSHADGTEPTIVFTDLSTNAPTSWFWDFNDGTTDIVENPTHTFLSNGSFNVCLTATNAVASDTYCEIITIDTYLAPAAAFTFTGDPVVTFTDLSANDPISWEWDFDDGTTSTEQNPVHTFALDGVYSVCLTATNTEGSDMACQDVVISNTPKIPVVDFSWSISGTTVSFTDLSTNDPDYWEWDFGDGGSSTEQNPSHFYPAPSAYTVCLTAGNVAGEDIVCKVLDFNSIHDINNAWDVLVFPNPASEQVIVSVAGYTGNPVLVTVTNAVGGIVRSAEITNNTALYTGDLPAGFYLLKITADEKSGTTTFVKD